ncbi:MAG: hypothetical protein LBU32_13110 [Clostridiales bacterium]|jgi:hypothetical protein|nr:hypothetical protein [Clostridiales bacterium]
MASITKLKIKNHYYYYYYYYYYLVESTRVNGKPRIAKQKYLGTAENIANAIDNMGSMSIPTPEFIKALYFGDVCALFDLAERLGVRDSINKHMDKRKQGLSVADMILLAVINRAVEPTSKNSFYHWFEKTALYNLIPNANQKSLSSQGFWNNMNALGDDQMRAIEDDITKESASHP